MDNAKVWEESVTIPTYGLGEPNPNPMFLEKRVYQGSSGVVYPHPVVEKILDEKKDKDYNAVFLENEYIKIMLLPELGGRVHSAYDKTNDYYFVYHNEVIKPALVGLTGPWISGGIEFNWPQHHRPSTFDPTDHRISQNEDGSATVWIGEIERMFRTKAMVGFTLHPGRAYLELDVRLYNRTSEPQTFLWWANPAVAVNDDYQSVFPPDVHAVMDHGKRDVSDFPVATGTYYKMDYSPGTDISLYKNIPVPTSFMAYHSDYNFIGCYDHGLKAGMLHVANHHVVPGKKQWTWGHSDFGRVWDRQLTDANGPYIELMCGAYTDNQPDFSWLMPGEEKRFTQIFMPYTAIGPACNADKDGAISLDVQDGKVRIGVYLTSPDEVEVMLVGCGKTLYSKVVALTPEAALVDELELDKDCQPSELTLSISSKARNLSFTPLSGEHPEIPEPATPAKKPEDLASVEELFLNGHHLEQYRHATYAPEPYYEEALRRDPGDSRCNNAMGLLLFRRGKFTEAEPYFRTAIKRVTLRNPNPYDGEPYYNLGLCLKMQERFEEAFDAFYKSVWNDAYQSAGYFELARLACRKGDFNEALELIDRSLARNNRHHKARHLKIMLLRKVGRPEEAIAGIAKALEADPIEFGALYEQKLISDESEFDSLMRGYVHNYIEIALDYIHAGCFVEAAELLDISPSGDPMIGYYRGWIETLRNDASEAKAAFIEAEQVSPKYCFPNRIECVPALKAAMATNPGDSRAPYYLGNFWYGHRCHKEGIECWERAVGFDPSFATPWRNLGLAYMNKQGDPVKSGDALETAFSLDSSDARIFFELDQLRKKTGIRVEERVVEMEKHMDVVLERDDQTIELLTAYNLLGKHVQALEILNSRHFHPWEGGEGKVAGQYVVALVELAKQAMDEGSFVDAIDFLQNARTYPHNLGEGKLQGAQENNILYYLGCAHEGLGEKETARKFFKEASIGLSVPTSVMYYNDQPPETILYKGLAMQKLGHDAEAVEVFQRLVDYGETHMDDDVEMDYFAVSLPDFLVFDEDLAVQNKVHCLYMCGLGHFGFGHMEEAESSFEKVLELAPFHIGTLMHKAMLPELCVSTLQP